MKVSGISVGKVYSTDWAFRKTCVIKMAMICKYTPVSVRIDQHEQRSKKPTIQYVSESFKGVVAMLVEQQSTAAGFCVTINAAFLQEVKEASCQVWDTLFQLRIVSQLAVPSEAKIHQWVQKLTEFRRQLSAEFALEETYGYISKAVRQHIACGVDPADTLKQHKDLYLHLIDICEQAEQAQYVGTVARDFGLHTAAFLEFDLMLSEHERAESLMIRYGLGLR